MQLFQYVVIATAFLADDNNVLVCPCKLIAPFSFRNHFHLQEIVSDANTPPVGSGLRVGVVFLSRQSPGVVNVLWGVHERLKLIGGQCFGFYGTDGLLEGKYLKITDQV